MTPLTFQLDGLRISAAPPLGEGGAALIQRCETADGRQMVFKRYSEDSLNDLDESALRHVIEWPGSLTVADRQPLMANSAWPQALVVNRRSVVGVLMNEAPKEFFYSRNGKSEPRHFNLVAVRKEQSAKRGYPYYDIPHKIARLGHLLTELQLFHSNGIVVGDLQTNNILTTGPESDQTGTTVTRNFWLDCDSFIVGGRAALPPMDPLSTRPPYPVQGFSAETDMYKFALLTIRCLSEHLGADTIDYDKFSEVLPSFDFDNLEKLLTLANPGLTSSDLGGMGRAWASTVKRDGRMYCRTDAALRELWTDAKRQKHLAGIAPPAPPAQRRVLAESSPTPKSSKQKLPKSRPIVTRLDATVTPAAPSSKKTVGKGAAAKTPDISGTKWHPARRDMVILAALGAVVFIAAVFIVAISQGDGRTSASSYTSTSRSRPASTTTFTTTTTAAAITTTPTFNALRDATVGDCIHREAGQDNGDGTSKVTVSSATCGTAYATDRVVTVTYDPANCQTYQDWVRSGSAGPPVVLCLAPE